MRMEKGRYQERRGEEGSKRTRRRNPDTPNCKKFASFLPESDVHVLTCACLRSAQRNPVPQMYLVFPQPDLLHPGNHRHLFHRTPRSGFFLLNTYRVKQADDIVEMKAGLTKKAFWVRVGDRYRSRAEDRDRGLYVRMTRCAWRKPTLSRREGSYANEDGCKVTEITEDKTREAGRAVVLRGTTMRSIRSLRRDRPYSRIRCGVKRSKLQSFVGRTSSLVLGSNEPLVVHPRLQVEWRLVQLYFRPSFPILSSFSFNLTSLYYTDIR
ncbi:hypothetical protein B0H12DRAFT_743506 [Mycena haematopus]|nr:hypothetical protein B0H12DRAFT_743506 [Mycena haematopus]